MNEPEDFRLTTQERQTPLWMKLDRYLDHQLAMLRARNDGDADERSTAKLRGHIAAIKALRSLANERPGAE